MWDKVVVVLGVKTAIDAVIPNHSWTHRYFGLLATTLEPNPLAGTVDGQAGGCRKPLPNTFPEMTSEWESGAHTGD